MPVDFNEDLMPRNVPKPAPLIEVAATPLVPEVSLLLDQDRNKSVHHNTSPYINYAEDKSKPSPIGGQKEVSYANQYESYNTWKAKNAQLLSAITGSSGIPETTTKHLTVEKCIGVQRPQSSGKEVYHRKEVNYAGTNFTRKVPRANHISKPEHECLDANTQNFGQHQVQNNDQQHINNLPSIPECYTQTANSYPQSGNREMMYLHKSPQSQNPNTFHNQTRPCFPFTSNGHSTVEKEMQFRNIHFNSQLDSKMHQNIDLASHSQVEPGYNTIQGNFDHGQCQCAHGQCERTSNNGVQYIDPQSCVSNTDRRKNMPSTYSKLVTPLDIAHVNNQAIIDLYHIINLQNEQISMLQQQVKQVLQIHMNCDKPEKQNINCCSCRCDHNAHCVSEKPSCSNAERENDSKNKSQKYPSNKTENGDTLKRSIGVMTSSVENTEDTNFAMQIEKQSVVKARNKKNRDNKPNTPSYNIANKPNCRDSNNEVRGRKKNTANTEKKTKPVESTRVDNSFSLNEAELVIRSEQSDLSPNTSVHVDLQDYCSSSIESDSDATASSSSGNEEQNSESGDDSTEPQIGWTFYNRVVGQVNNILKKKPTPPRQDNPHMYRTPGGHMYGLNTDFETENNWSKRVTFDGPPHEDSENNTPNLRELPKFEQTMPHQDMRPKDGHRRMQDFMMYNFANGNTNLSFATLRYLDRHHMLPSQGKSKPVEQMYQQQTHQKSNKKYMKKKTRNVEKFSDLHPHMNIRKSSTPSSKLLDITALKQQPKLF